MEHSNCPVLHEAMKLAKLRTKKPSESKCKGREITDIGKKNEKQQQKNVNEIPTIMMTTTLSAKTTMNTMAVVFDIICFDMFLSVLVFWFLSKTSSRKDILGSPKKFMNQGKVKPVFLHLTGESTHR